MHAGQMMSSRYFNRLQLNPGEGTITKRSSDIHKLINEINWYLSLPEELKTYIPEIKRYSLEIEDAFLTMSYIPSHPLTAWYGLENVKPFEWETIFDKLQTILRLFSMYTGPVTAEHAKEMYVYKTISRLESFFHQQEWAKSINRIGYFYLNDRILPCPLWLLEKSLPHLNELLKLPTAHVMHGDFCFSNLLYNPESQSLTMIDPRGSFGAAGIYGDSRYDLAKIRHSLNGYDHFIQDRFFVRRTENSISLGISFRQDQVELRNVWDSFLGSSKADVKLIESLLFLSMLPLHSDRPERQMAMYAWGTSLLCEAVSLR